MYTFFDKFCAAIVKLEAVNITLDYVQKRVEETQNSKSTSVILNVHLLMEKIQSCLNSSKDKKNSQTLALTVNSAQVDTVTADNNMSDSACESQSDCDCDSFCDEA
ncbi:hypothetical protein EMPG_11219 [Blastomyces silverae]|uniref:Uncharacterized protein n=1 Tax=Blastomyces silverae TaxID=2060906 RepID=A0A0H1BQQ9_9EURO|nr:hypothetical protein EMPG_11219 [Blastomyces silverae]